ncbi:HBL101Wp [Eremothecium sinecaudum]|uniref:HBL101Wp n=1 Tax=Eremothecium sinecaudum TaxID=45286 RepID=A0A125RDW9_9SACH|nr:HBL101Wp [Eremothecium sinecaudum]AMD18801.1 HBL101Wp [Eremothecium sinecaudum]
MNFEDPWRYSGSANGYTATEELLEQRVKQTVKELPGESDLWCEVVILISQDDENVLSFRALVEEIGDRVNEKAQTGVTLLIYAIVYNHPTYVELLHETGKLDVNIPDDLTTYSPLMWCLTLKRKECCVELLNYDDELDLSYRNGNGATAIDLLLPGSEMYEFAKNHRMQNLSVSATSPISSTVDLYTGPARNMDVEDTLDNIKLQVAGLNLNEGENADLYVPPSNNNSEALNTQVMFDFENLIQGEYVEFAEYDIMKILDLLISLPQKQPNDPVAPAALIFQCLRYAHRKAESNILVDKMFNLSLTRILSSQQSTTGGVVTDRKGDIVDHSYWLSCLTFLYYYLYRDERFFKKYPILLQDLINAMQTLMIEICSSVMSRVKDLIVPAILTHTTIFDVKETLYKKDWNFFKKRKQPSKKMRSSYDDILHMLYPPSMEEQMKVSPIKIVQIFGALSYVLELHHIHPFFYIQCISTSIKWFSNSVFNHIITSRKYLSRAQAIQIRFNLSAIEDWIKNHDMKVNYSTMIDTFIWERFPYTLIKPVSEINLKMKSLRNVTMYTPVDNDNIPIRDNHNSLFYHQSLYRISQLYMEPLLQLLQWLQVATSLQDDESLTYTMGLLSVLTPAQMLRVVEKYRYEVDEHRFKSPLKKLLSSLVKKGSEVLLPESSHILVILPMMNELIEVYVSCDNAAKFVPLLSEKLQDEIELLHEHNMRERLIDVNPGHRINGELSTQKVEPVISSGAENYKTEDDSARAVEPRSAFSLKEQSNWSSTVDCENNPW